MTQKKQKTAKRRASRKRAVIKTAALVSALESHALGDIEMSASQVNVALSLLKIFAQPHKEKNREDSAAPRHEDALAALE